jgi:hypothetical protein
MEDILNRLLDDLKEIRKAYKNGSHTELYVQNKTMIQISSNLPAPIK